MTTPESRPRWLLIDDCVEAFEAALARDGRADLRAFLPPDNHGEFSAVAAELVRVDLEHAWRCGEPRDPEAYRAMLPRLFRDPDALRQVAFEHFRLRRDRGEPAEPGEYARRFGVDTGDWASRLAGSPAAPGPEPVPNLANAARTYERFRLDPASDDPKALDRFWESLPGPQSVAELFRDLHYVDPNAAARLARAAASPPTVGDTLLEFQLVEHLGRGAFADVFLARQRSLAGRPVVLKVSTDLLGEPRTLAQLQHTNIVPIYSVHHVREFQLVCMPYFGATTLADVLWDLHGLGHLPNSGRQLLSTIQNRHPRTLDGGAAPSRGAETESETPTTAPDSTPPTVGPEALRRLADSSYIDAVLWLGARLAEGLAHAHARGIYHHDLKPANILLADDGRPMLLDFNLAEDTKLLRSVAAVRVGGTLPYMAPEHLERYRTGAGRVDNRSDLYSLGLILFELLTGRHPFPTSAGPLTEVLPAMLAARRAPPSPRSFNPAVSPAAASIVRHCHEAAPDARYQEAGQLREDLERQLLHRPLKFAPEPSLKERAAKWRQRHPRLASLTTLILLAVGLSAGLAGAVGHAWSQGARQHERQRLAAFLAEKEDVEIRIGMGGDVEPLDGVLARARRLLDDYGAGAAPGWLGQSPLHRLPSDERERLAEEAGNLALFVARAEGLQARRLPAVERGGRLEAALRWNERARECFPEGRRPRAVEWQREDLLRLVDPDRPAPEPAARRLDGSEAARDAYLLARDRFAEGRYEEALALARQAVRRDPRLFAAQFLVGNCLLRLGLDHQAEPAFGTCVALAPELAWPYFNRGTVRHRLMQYEAAREDFDRAIELAPDLVDAFVERAQVRQRLKDYAGAIADLTHALENGAPPATAYALRSRTRALAGDTEGARADREAGLRTEPTNEQGWVARGLARLPAEPRDALADFDRAQVLNPRSRPARQNRAYVLSELLKQPAESVAVLDGLLDDYPDYLPARGGRGVLLARLGRRPEAHADARACLRLSQRPEVLYQVAGIYALTSRQEPGDADEALRLLAAALSDRGHGLDLIDRDADLDPVRGQVEFKRLVSAARHVHQAARRASATGP